MAKTDIKSMTEAELEEFLLELGEKKFRAGQLFKWLQSGTEDFDQMTNLPKDLRETLKEKAYIANTVIVRRLVSKLTVRLNIFTDCLTAN